MPYPRKYKEYATLISPYKWYFLLIAVVGVSISVISILMSVKYQINLMFLHGVGFLLLMWGWGLFLIPNWYGKTPKFSIKIPQFIMIISEWFSSMFLDVWFIVGTICAVLFILNSTFEIHGSVELSA